MQTSPFAWAPLIKHSLDVGGVLVADELGSHLHPVLADYLIDLFKATHPNAIEARIPERVKRA
ncbi:MAG: hypothetical protein V4458_05940 [Pseudomonadota bacterium]